MRRGLYVVLMVVLVLRGLMGTAMAAGVLPPLLPLASDARHAPTHSHRAAAEPAAQPLVAAAFSSSNSTDHHGDPAHHGESTHHGEHAGHTACEGHPSGCSAHDHHSAACSACEICHSAMLNVSAPNTCAQSSRGTEPAPASARFDSAPAAQSFKPPIA